LTKCGALDNFGERNQILTGMDQILSLTRETHNARKNGQVSLFSDQMNIETPSLRLLEVEPADKKKFLVGKRITRTIYF